MSAEFSFDSEFAWAFWSLAAKEVACEEKEAMALFRWKSTKARHSSPHGTERIHAATGLVLVTEGAAFRT
ncbi:hypothetical protein RJ639_047753 [Escallonia herrerae]|uniref:Uncharacterized protein n=1 Tax=Escallonia herrerae TaxID=1293975 RepID=A0AA88W6D3_9ASTE|nr:hypothetical protein RJ639_047753 [Escallonia herrerae]